jgi:hypothetical protein
MLWMNCHFGTRIVGYWTQKVQQSVQWQSIQILIVYFLWRSYPCNQCISPLTLWVRTPRCILYNICDKVCEWLSVGRWFSPGTPASSTNRIVESGVKHHKPKSSQSIASNICINGVFFNITFISLSTRQ